MSDRGDAWRETEPRGEEIVQGARMETKAGGGRVQSTERKPVPVPGFRIFAMKMTDTSASPNYELKLFEKQNWFVKRADLGMGTVKYNEGGTVSTMTGGDSAPPASGQSDFSGWTGAEDASKGVDIVDTLGSGEMNVLVGNDTTGTSWSWTLADSTTIDLNSGKLYLMDVYLRNMNLPSGSVQPSLRMRLTSATDQDKVDYWMDMDGSNGNSGGLDGSADFTRYTLAFQPSLSSSQGTSDGNGNRVLSYTPEIQLYDKSGTVSQGSWHIRRVVVTEHSVPSKTAGN